MKTCLSYYGGRYIITVVRYNIEVVSGLTLWVLLLIYLGKE
jgi:hypothetical protein